MNLKGSKICNIQQIRPKSCQIKAVTYLPTLLLRTAMMTANWLPWAFWFPVWILDWCGQVFVDGFYFFRFFYWFRFWIRVWFRIRIRVWVWIRVWIWFWFGCWFRFRFSFFFRFFFRFRFYFRLSCRCFRFLKQFNLFLIRQKKLFKNFYSKLIIVVLKAE